MTTLRRQVKNMVKNYSEAEVKVREATSNDPWGPSSTLMSEISDLTYNIVALGEVMRMIWKRLNDHGKNWRHVYKSLVLLDYLIKNGNEKVAQQCKEHIVAIQTLKDFQYMEEQKDQGQSVREKAKQLVNLLRDDERLKQERTKAFKARERFAQNAMGISSDNKLTYATSVTSSQASQNRTAYGAGAAGSYADPYGGAGAQPEQLGPDLEAVRPSDTNEEDLQIKLAIMLSQQEHDEEAQKRRADEAKLMLALEQSKAEGQPNGLVDLCDLGNTNSGDPWSTNNNTSKQPEQELDSASDEFFPPLFNNNKNVSQPPQKPALDPWGPANTNQLVSPQQQMTANPWQSPQAAAADPWAVPTTQQKTDEFDLFTSDRAVNQSPQTAQIQNNNNLSSDPFGDFFGSTSIDQNNSNNSTNPWNSADDQKKQMNQPSSIQPLNNQPQPTASSQSQFNTAANQRKTPESFLGENSSLVNLENLIPARPKSTNPFGTSNSPMTLPTSNSSGQLNNPFLAQQALQNQNKPTISQLQSQQKQQQAAFPSFGTQNQNQNGQFGQLPKPLIPPSNSIQNIQPMSFNSTPVQPAPVQQNMTNFGDFNAFNNGTGNGQTTGSTTNPFLMM